MTCRVPGFRNGRELRYLERSRFGCVAHRYSTAHRVHIAIQLKELH